MYRDTLNRWRILIIIINVIIMVGCLVGISFADIIAPAMAPEHSLIKAESSETGKAHFWFIVGPRMFETWQPVAPANQAIVFTGPPGSYMVMLAVLQEDGTASQSQTTIVIEGDRPKPDPKPDPDPPPPPPPPVTDPYVTLIEERDDGQRGLEGATITGHLEQIRSYLKRTKVGWQLIDQDWTNAAEYLNYLSNAKIRTLPALIITDQTTDTVVTVAAFGDSAAETIEILKKAGVK